MSIAKIAQTDQIFSHCHFFVYFVGVAKLPFSTPARSDRITPPTTLFINFFSLFLHGPKGPLEKWKPAEYTQFASPRYDARRQEGAFQRCRPKMNYFSVWI